MRLIILGLLMLTSLTACRESTARDEAQAKIERLGCDIRELDCLYPPPPIGRWKAVYTKDFAEKYNLPPENISTNFSPGVDYMEMEVLPYNKDKGTACMVSMLIKKPNDIAFYYWGDNEHAWVQDFHANRKLSHFLDLEQHKSRLKQIGTFEAAAGKYYGKSGGE